MLRSMLQIVKMVGPPNLPCCPKCLRRPPINSLQLARTTVTVERVHPVPLYKEGNQPRLKTRHYIYKVLGTKNFVGVKAKCILLSDVKWVGQAGTIVEVRQALFYHKLFPGGQAVFATDVNLEVYDDIIQERKRLDMEQAAQISEFIRAEETAKSMTRLRLPIPMNGKNPWVLNPSHVRVALWNVGIEAEDRAITLPETPVTNPGEITLSVSINDKYSVRFIGEVYSVFWGDSDWTIPSRFKNFLDSTPLDDCLEIKSAQETKSSIGQDDDCLENKSAQETKSAIDLDEHSKPSDDQDECENKLPDDGDDKS